MRLHGGHGKDGETGVKLTDLIADRGTKLLGIAFGINKQIGDRGVALGERKISVELGCFVEKEIFAGAGEANYLDRWTVLFGAKDFADGILAGPDSWAKVSLMMATRGAEALSASVNSRPLITGTPAVRK